MNYLLIKQLITYAALENSILDQLNKMTEQSLSRSSSGEGSNNIYQIKRLDIN